MSPRKSPINKLAVVFIIGCVTGYLLHVIVLERQAVNSRLEAMSKDLNSVESYLMKTQQKVSTPRPVVKDKEEEAQ